MSRLQELYALRDQVTAAIAREEAALLRMARLRDAVHEVVEGQLPADTMAVLEAVAEEYSVEVHMLTGRDRETGAVAPRHVAAAVLRYLGLSYPQIGRILAKDHTTVMSSVNRVAVDVDLSAAQGRVIARLAERHPAIRLAVAS